MILGILGGMGPQAGVNLHRAIISNTLSQGDSEHLRVIHLSFSSDIGDRTTFSKKHTPTRQYTERLVNLVRSLSSIASSLNTSCVIGVPCNTFHSPVIWDTFQEHVRESVPTTSRCTATSQSHIRLRGGTKAKEKSGTVHLLNMASLTVDKIQSMVSLEGIRAVGILCTTGTRDARVYSSPLTSIGVRVIELSVKDHDLLQQTIYHPDTGLKALSHATEAHVERLKSLIVSLRHRGADAVLLGCSELEIALPYTYCDGVLLIKPVEILARTMIQNANPLKLAPERPPLYSKYQLGASSSSRL